MFFGGHATALIDNLIAVDAAWRLADRSPLGSGASYGVGLPLDRQRCADLLGFADAGAIAMADANSRGKVEAFALDAVGTIVGDLSRFAADIVFFTTAECSFLALEAGFTTGSSIMPQKRNPDLFELLRGRSARYLGLRNGLAAMTLGLHSGYSRDLQDTKALVMDGIALAERGLAVMSRSVPALTPRRDRIEAALTPDLYATDEAYRLVREEGRPFREAYVEVGRNLDALGTPDHEAVLRARTHAGSTGALGLDHLRARLDEAADQWQQRSDDLHATWQRLLQD
jgi:argininosuccinate lyase